MIRFDAYTATVVGARAHELAQLLFQVPTDKHRAGRGLHNFKERVGVVDDTGAEVGAVMWGGAHGDRALIEVKGERTPGVVEGFRAAWPEHRCTRVDSCRDFEGEGTFERLLGPLLEVKRRHELYGDRGGDWEMPELGRTQYLGATSSAVRVRLYEKGKQPEYRHLERPTWCRLEIQVRPQKGAKTAFSVATPAEVWGASAFSRELSGLVLGAEAGKLAAGGGRRLPSVERAWRWMCAQYGPVIVAKLAEFEGDFERLGVAIADEAARQEGLKKRWKGGAGWH